jgi:23S rRNA pseudouridine2605 synthase
VPAKPPAGGSRRKPGQVSLDRALSKLGLASRTVARDLIVQGRVRVNGEVRKHPGYPVNPDRARIEIDGLAPPTPTFRAFVLNKPRGVVTTRSDEQGRKTVISILPPELQQMHLAIVGRLDLATTGLLILTNDTRLSSWLTDPTNAIPRTYITRVEGEVTPEHVRQLKQGILDQGEFLKPLELQILKASKRECHLRVILTEGKNREIRRLFSHIGTEVRDLKRIAYGSLELGDLPVGALRELTPAEVERAFPEAPRATTLRAAPSLA